MLQFSNVVFKFGDTPLFEDLSFTVHARHKVGIVGKNGVGKSTLFQLIRRRFVPEEGDILYPASWRIAWLRQDVTPTERSALDFVMDGDAQLRRAQGNIQRAQQDEDGQKLAHAYAEFEDLDGYQFESKAASILVGLGFSTEDFDKPHREFSGGWRIRLNLAQVLMNPAELMLLDEPTNHLDLEATVWLQKWIAKHEGTVVVIAHDRDFLDRVVDTIIHLDQLRAFTYRGGYSSFESQRAALLMRQEAMHRRQAKERERIQKFIDRFRAKATKARQVQSRIKMLERMTDVVVLRTQLPYEFAFDAPSRFDEPMVFLDDCSLGYADHPVLSGITERIYPRDRIGILGLNGAGKSTLLKALAGVIEPLSGTLQHSEHTTVGYFAQHQLEVLNGDRSARDQIREVADMSEQRVRNYLGTWGFGGDDIFRPVKQFSGGEKARLVLAKIGLSKPAVLILDEPTNHLDIDMREALSNALDSYRGAVVVVAHDQHLLRRCVSEFWLVNQGKVEHFDGDLEDYESMVSVDSATPSKTKTRSSRELRRERAATRQSQKDLVARRRTLEKQLGELGDEMNELLAKLTDPETFKTGERSEVETWMRRHSKTQQKIKDLENEWMSIEEKLDP